MVCKTKEQKLEEGNGGGEKKCVLLSLSAS